MTILKGIKNDQASDTDRVANEFIEYNGYEVRNNLLEIMIFEKGEVPSEFRKTLIKPLHKKGDESECGRYRGVSLVSVGSKLLSMMILYGLKDDVDKFLKEEQCALGREEDVTTKCSLLG